VHPENVDEKFCTNEQLVNSAAGILVKPVQLENDDAKLETTWQF
jgi:hypothetical protein